MKLQFAGEGRFAMQAYADGTTFFAKAPEVDAEVLNVKHERRIELRSFCTCGRCQTAESEALGNLAEDLRTIAVAGRA